MPLSTETDQGNDVSLGVSLYKLPFHKAASSSQNCNLSRGWFRVLGRDGAINCKSTVFIYAELPPLIPAPMCKLENSGYLDFPEKAEIAFVEFNWGGNLLSGAVPVVSSFRPHSTLSIDNHSLVDLWLVWSGDASSTDFVPNGHASKHGGGSIFSANFLITVYRNNGGQIGDKIGNAAITIHGADAGELVVRDRFLFLVTATDAIKIGLLIFGNQKRALPSQLNSYRDVQKLFGDFIAANGIDVRDAPHAAFWNDLTYDQFVNGDVPGVPGVKILVKGNAAGSNIVSILKGPITVQGTNYDQMPEGGPFMTDGQINSLADWINRNCPNS